MSCKYVAIKETNKLNWTISFEDKCTLQHLKRRILKTQFLRCKMPLLLIIGWKMGPNIYLPSVHSSQVSMRYSYNNAFIIHTKKEMIFIIDFEWYWISIFVSISISPSNMIWPWAVRIFFPKTNTIYSREITSSKGKDNFYCYIHKSNSHISAQL